MRESPLLWSPPQLPLSPSPLAQPNALSKNLGSALAIGAAAILFTIALLVFYFCRYVTAEAAAAAADPEADDSSTSSTAATHCGGEAKKPAPGIELDKFLPSLASHDAMRLLSDRRRGGGAECCAVCLTEFGGGDEAESGRNLRLLPDCAHCFHVDCVDEWLRTRMQCPVCRAPLVFDRQ